MLVKGRKSYRRIWWLLKFTSKNSTVIMIMKIGFVLPNYGAGISGGLKIIYEYANYLSERNEVILYDYVDRTLDYLPRFIPIQLKKIYGNTKAQIEPRWFKLNKSIKKKAIFDISEIDDGDVIIATAIRTAEPTAALSKSKGKKYYFIQGFENWHCSDEEVYATYSIGMKNIVVARWLKEKVDQWSSEPSILVPNGINTHIFKYKNSQDRRPPHSIAMHYRDAWCKGSEYALEAIRILERQYSDLQVNVVGITPPPGDLPKSCKYFKNISAEEVANINNNSSIFLCSSIQEGFGLPGLEAMACGCALVSSRFQGVLEYANERNAILVPPENAEELAEKISILFENEKQRKSLAEEGSKTAMEMSNEKSCKKLEAVISELI